MHRRSIRLFSLLLTLSLLLSATLLPASAASGGFRDVPASHWAAASITRSVKAGLFRGETATTFGLGHCMTRAAFVTVLGRMFQWKTVTPSVGSFTDNQDKTAWYYSAVETACANGTITRQTAKFRPNDPITREELAVMLVRALGYGSIAGLAQELPLPFTDITSNMGYLSMAYELGIVTGTGKATFSPDRVATREQAAVMVMRVYDRYHAAAPGVAGIADSAIGLTLDGISAAAVPAFQLTGTGSPQLIRSTQNSTAIREAVQAGGVQPLLGITGTASALRAKAADSAALIAAAAAEGGYSGVLLDLPKLTETSRTALTELTAAVKSALGSKTLWVVAETPVWQGTAYGGYDYAALSKQADRLILRVTSYSKVLTGVPTAPQEPLEELYYALSTLNGAAEMSKLSIWLTTSGSAWAGVNRTGTSSPQQIADLLALPSTVSYYSTRYGNAYLVRTVNASRTVVWYHDARSARDCRELAAFFGVKQVFLSGLSGPLNAGTDSLLRGLK